MKGRKSMMALIAVTIAIDMEMEAFHKREVLYYCLDMPNLCVYPGMRYHVWFPWLTKGIPTTVCLN